MNKIKDFSIKPFKSSNYIKPISMTYTQVGKVKRRDILSGHDAVNVMLFNISRKVLVFIKQFRPVIYLGSTPTKIEMDSTTIDVEKHPPENGVTVELCGGIVNKNAALNVIAAEKVLNKCCYEIQPSKLEPIFTYRSGVGIMGRLQTLFYCEVTDDMKTPSLGDSEVIEVLEMTIPEVQNYINKDNILSPSNFLFAVHWFLQNKVK